MRYSQSHAVTSVVAACLCGSVTGCQKAAQVSRNPGVVGARDFFNLLRPLKTGDSNGGPVFSGAGVAIRPIPKPGGGEQYELEVENGSAFVLDPGHSARLHQRYRIHAEFTISGGEGGFGILFNARPIRDPTRWPISPAFVFDTKGYVQGKFFPLDESISQQHQCSLSNVRQVVTIDVDGGSATMRWSASTAGNANSNQEKHTVTLIEHRTRGGSWGFRLWHHTRVVLHDLTLDWDYDDELQPPGHTAIVIAPHVYLLHDAVDPLVRESGDRILQALRKNHAARVVSLMGANARKPNIRWVLTEGRRRDEREDLLLIFLVAQGRLARHDSLPCIQPAETMLHACEGTGFLTWELPFLAQVASKARIAFFIDACQHNNLFDAFPKRLELLLRERIVVFTPHADLSYECDVGRNITCFAHAISTALTKTASGSTLGALVAAIESAMVASDKRLQNKPQRYINVFAGPDSHWRAWTL